MAVASVTGHGRTGYKVEIENPVEPNVISHARSSFFASVLLFRAATRIQIPATSGSRLHLHLAGMILKSYTKPIDGTIPVQALLYDDEQLLGSQEGVGIYDG
jgi:hypothetical protein